ncbi:MAG: hypothetical protein EBS55_12430 [Flavobacteriaceae bacterium]|nr:hypothetical protein [Flavobacteriaceae bacterium]
MASIFQSVLAEPYLIANKFEIRVASDNSYYSAAILGACVLSFLSLPIVFLITGSFLLTIILYVPIVGMLLQDELRYLLIQKKKWHRLIFSDAIWVVMLIILMYFSKSEGLSMLFFAWGLSGIFALVVIVDFREIFAFSLGTGFKLLLHYASKYFFAFIETTLSGLLLISCNWFIANFLGEEEISLYRLLALLYGISTVLINRQRVFDFAQEQPREDRFASFQRIYKRFRELFIIVILNFLLVCILLYTMTNFFAIEFSVSPSYFLLLAGGFERLSIGALMSITVFVKSHENPSKIAWIRTCTIFVSFITCAVLSFFGAALSVVVAISSVTYLFVAIYLLFQVDKSVYKNH